MFYARPKVATAVAAAVALLAGVALRQARAGEKAGPAEAKAGTAAPAAPPAQQGERAVPEHLTRDLFSLRNPAGRASTVGAPLGTTREAENAVEAGLAWLAKAQEPNGSWSSAHWGGAAGYDTGVTGLALMAFLGAGYTQWKGQFKATVAKGLDWLKANQEADGSFKWKVFYEQGMATIAACEAYAMTQQGQLRPLAERAVLLICREQPEHGGFRYRGGTTEADGDLSVSGWQMTAIASGICGGIESIPPHAIGRSRVLLKNAYRPDGGSVYVVGAGEGNTSPSMTAIGMLCRELFGGPDTDAEILASAEYLDAYRRRVQVGGQAEPRVAASLYCTYYASLAMFQMGGKHWERWIAFYRNPLVRDQVLKGLDGDGRFIRGSWDLTQCPFGRAGGRVYTTAMAVLCLETPYRYKRVFKRPTDF